MKKILVVICLLLISGCYSDNYKELGYSNLEAKHIRSLKKDNQVFFRTYDEKLISIITNDEFKEENIELYVDFKDLLSANLVVEAVNNNLISIYNIGTVTRLVNSEHFDETKLKDYLEYANYVEEQVAVYMVNNNITSYEFVEELEKDDFFILDNLNLYLKYKDEKDTVRDLIEYVNTRRYETYYEEIIDSKIEIYSIQVLVNKYYNLPEDYEPNDLVDVEYGRGKLRKVAYDAYLEMKEAAQKEGLDFYITSPYRSYQTQYTLYNYYLSMDSMENVDTYSARPGSSEHQLGLAVDILKSGYDFGNFYLTEEAKWLEENAHKYGFILRYPSEKEDITGYKYEPWHYRYVGAIATDVYNSGVTYDEYFEKYIK